MTKMTRNFIKLCITVSIAVFTKTVTVLDEGNNGIVNGECVYGPLPRGDSLLPAKNLSKTTPWVLTGSQHSTGKPVTSFFHCVSPVSPNSACGA